MASRALAAVPDMRMTTHRSMQACFHRCGSPSSCTGLGRCSIQSLEGYWGGTSIPTATENCLNIIRAHKEKIRRHKNLSTRRGLRNLYAP